MTNHDEDEEFSSEDFDSDDFDSEELLWAYRFAYETGDVETCDELRERWTADFDAGDLHSFAYRHPVSRDELNERRESLTAVLRHVEAQLAWLDTIKTA
jgi:hypothetical protein